MIVAQLGKACSYVPSNVFLRALRCVIASSMPSSDLPFQMEEAGVSAAVQKKIYALGFTCLRTFAGIEETRVAVREVLTTHFGLDCKTDPTLLRDIALLLSVWEAARVQLTYTKSRTNRNGHSTAPTLKDKEAPSKSLVAPGWSKLKEGAAAAEDLREVTSLEDAETEAYNAMIDSARATLRIRPGKSMAVPPTNPEALRLRHRRLGLAWDFVKSRHSARAWLPASSVNAFRKLSDFTLGSEVAGLHAADGHQPSWSLVLSFELDVRKLAYGFVCNS